MPLSDAQPQPAEDEDSYASIGISACMLILCVGTVLLFALRLLAQRYAAHAHLFRLPSDSLLWVVLGLTTGLTLQYGYSARLAKVVELVDESFPSIFFAVLLPPIIFEAGYSLDQGRFAAQLWPALVLAGPGTLLSALAVGAILFVGGALGLAFRFSVLDALLLGTVVSATDTVSVLTTLESGVVRPDVFALVFGESVLNDAVALVLYRTLAGFERAHTASAASVGWACLAFLGVLLGSTLMGVAVAAGAALVFKHFSLRPASARNATTLARQDPQAAESDAAVLLPAEAADTADEGVATEAVAATAASSGWRSSSSGGSASGGYGVGAAHAVDVSAVAATGSYSADEPASLTLTAEVERTLYVVLPFLSYFCAEGAELSGVVSALFCGMVMGRTAQRNISTDTRRFARALFRLLASLFEALVFVYIGIALPQLGSDMLRRNWPTALVLTLACLAGRAVGVWACCAVINRLDAVPTGATSLTASPSAADRESIGARLRRVPQDVAAAARPAWRRMTAAVMQLAALPSWLANYVLFSALRRDTLQAAPAAAASAGTKASAALRISKESRLFLWWCGLRGGVAFALALHARQLVDGEAGEAVAIATLFVVALSLLVIPPTIGPLAMQLKLQGDGTAASTPLAAAQTAAPVASPVAAPAADASITASATLVSEASVARGEAVNGVERSAADAPAELALPSASSNTSSLAASVRAAVPSRAVVEARLQQGMQIAASFLTAEAEQ